MYKKQLQKKNKKKIVNVFGYEFPIGSFVIMIRGAIVIRSSSCNYYYNKIV